MTVGKIKQEDLSPSHIIGGEAAKKEEAIRKQNHDNGRTTAGVARSYSTPNPVVFPSASMTGTAVQRRQSAQTELQKNFSNCIANRDSHRHSTGPASAWWPNLPSHPPTTATASNASTVAPTSWPPPNNSFFGRGHQNAVAEGGHKLSPLPYHQQHYVEKNWPPQDVKNNYSGQVHHRQSLGGRFLEPKTKAASFTYTGIDYDDILPSKDDRRRASDSFIALPATPTGMIGTAGNEGAIGMTIPQLDSYPSFVSPLQADAKRAAVTPSLASPHEGPVGFPISAKGKRGEQKTKPRRKRTTKTRGPRKHKGADNVEGSALPPKKRIFPSSRTETTATARFPSQSCLGVIGRGKPNKGGHGMDLGGLFEKPQDDDVICTRCLSAKTHPGNCYYMDLVHQRQIELEADNTGPVTSIDRYSAARDIVNSVRKRQGKFLFKYKDSQCFYDIGDKTAVRKTCLLLSRPVVKPEKTDKGSTEDDEETPAEVLDKINVVAKSGLDASTMVSEVMKLIAIPPKVDAREWEMTLQNKRNVSGNSNSNNTSPTCRSPISTDSGYFVQSPVAADCMDISLPTQDEGEVAMEKKESSQMLDCSISTRRASTGAINRAHAREASRVLPTMQAQTTYCQFGKEEQHLLQDICPPLSPYYHSSREMAYQQEELNLATYGQKDNPSYIQQHFGLMSNAEFVGLSGPGIDKGRSRSLPIAPTRQTDIATLAAIKTARQQLASSPTPSAGEPGERGDDMTNI